MHIYVLQNLLEENGIIVLTIKECKKMVTRDYQNFKQKTKNKKGRKASASLLPVFQIQYFQCRQLIQAY